MTHLFNAEYHIAALEIYNAWIHQMYLIIKGNNLVYTELRIPQTYRMYIYLMLNIYQVKYNT